MAVEIKPVLKDQLGELREIVETTFLQAFAHRNTAEDIAIYSAQAFTNAQIEKEFENKNSAFFFLFEDEQLAGYLKLNQGSAQSDTKLSHALEVERIYLLSDFQSRGLGETLFDFSVKYARDRKLKWIWLGVWNENHRAIAFYERLGLKKFSTHAFKLGHDLQTDVLMKIAI